MEIQEFVSTVIIDIVKGINKASEELKDSGARINPTIKAHDIAIEEGHKGHRSIQHIEMSIAVTVGDTRDKGGKAGINVAGFSAEVLAGKSSAINSSVSTVKFVVPIAFPVGQ